MSDISWLIARLSRMTPGEVVHRIRERLTRTILTSRPKADQALVIRDPSEFASAVLARVSAAEVLATAAATRESVQAYGFTWPRDEHGHLRWSRFFSGADTADLGAFKIRYRSSGSVADDIRLPWELNRLTWLIPVAAAAAMGDEDSAPFVVDEVESFLDTDTPGKSLRWNSAIELAMQSLSLLVINEFMHGRANWDALSRRLGWALAHRLHWLERLPSRFSSANNHRLAELVAMVALTEKSSSESAPNDIARELASEVRKQFLSDGFNAELSFDYHLYSLDLLVATRLLAPKTSQALGLSQLLTPIGDTTLRIADFHQSWPSANDSDEALLLGTLFSRSEVPRALARLAGAADATKSTEDVWTLPQAGYTFMRRPLGASGAMVVLDHGAIGYGRIAAHGHSDVLGIWLTVGNEPWLVEAGTFCYHASETARDQLRHSHMHNTITIDDQSLSSPLGPFLWNPNNCATGTLESLQHEDGEIRATVSARRRGQLIARRSLVWTEDSLTITDSATASRNLKSHFILAPRFTLTAESRQNLAMFEDTDGDCIQFEVPRGARIDLDEVQISPRYGRLTPTTRLTVSSTGQHSTRITVAPATKGAE